MGLVGFLVCMGLLAGCAAATSRFKRIWMRSSSRRYKFAADGLEDGPLVSVVIPARNEQENLGGLLESVLAQSYRAMEVIIVDDASTDGTARIAAEFAGRDARIRVAAAGAVPPGWTGKTHACDAGARLARGEYLLLLDCDVRLEKAGCVGGMVAYARRENVDLYSVIPRQHLDGFWEKLLGPAVYTVAGLGFLPLGELNDPGRPKAAAVGQCMFFRRSSYEELGGHAAVKGHMTEDIAFGKLFKSSGKRLVVHYGPDAFTVRMYTSLGQMWEGWTRNLYRTAAGSFAAVGRVQLAFVFAYLVPPAVLLWALVLLARRGSTGYGVAAAAAAALSLAYSHLLRIKKYAAMRWPLRYEIGYELAVVFALVLLCVSALRDTRAGGLAWKGRTYTACGPGPADAEARPLAMNAGQAAGRPGAEQ